MKNKFSEFLELHNQAEPLLIGNVWNVQSARALESEGLKALATSSASVAETMGYEDGERMTFKEYLFVIERLAKCSKVPFSVDLETGYGESPEMISNNIKSLYNLGVCGINIEDSSLSNGTRTIDAALAFAGKIQHIKNLLDKDRIEIFINIRCDAFLLGLNDALEEAIARTTLYNTSGAHGIFMPCIINIDDIKKICAASALPVNVMCMPALPDFDQLQSAGVRRISMGPFLNKSLYQNLGASVQKIVKDRSFSSLFK